jgi:hypothetical protein
MKRVLIVIAAGSFFIFSCNKTSLTGKKYSPSLSGKWKYAQAFYSNGGPLIYESTESLNQWIVFNADSSVTTNMPEFEKVVSYQPMDSARVKFITPSQQPGFRLYHYFLDSTDNSLTLSPADFICIEGCGDKFRR